MSEKMPELALEPIDSDDSIAKPTADLTPKVTAPAVELDLTPPVNTPAVEPSLDLTPPVSAPATSTKVDIAPSAKPQAKKTILAIKIKNKAALYGAYMPFLKGGGLFIPTRQKYNLGDALRLRIELVEVNETVDVSGIVAWITPAAAQGNRTAGIGVQFTSDNALTTVELIERQLVGLLMTDHPTHTM